MEFIKNVPAAIRSLRTLGFPLKNIRMALPKLTGVPHKEIAHQIDTSKSNITAHMTGRRHNAIIQKRIIHFYGLSELEELFENE